MAFAAVAGAFAGQAAAAQKPSTQSERYGKINAMEIGEAIQRIRKKDWNLLEPPIQIPTNAAAAIAPLVTDEDQEIRELAVSAIDKTTGPEAKNALLKALNDRNEVVRGAAARFLQHHCSTNDADLIIGQLRSHKDEYVREQLALLLGKLGGRAALRPLQECFAIEEWPHTKRAMSLALTRLGDPDHRQTYIALLEQPDPKRRVAALEDLLYLEDQTLAKNVARLLDDQRDSGSPHPVPRSRKIPGRLPSGQAAAGPPAAPTPPSRSPEALAEPLCASFLARARIRSSGTS
jgi:hypothetical protein